MAESNTRIQHHLAPAGMAPGTGYSHAVVAAGRMVAIAGKVAMDDRGELVGAENPRAQALNGSSRTCGWPSRPPGLRSRTWSSSGCSPRTSRSSPWSERSGTVTSTPTVRPRAPRCRLPRCSGLATSWRLRRSPLWPESTSSSCHQPGGASIIQSSRLHSFERGRLATSSLPA